MARRRSLGLLLLLAACEPSGGPGRSAGPSAGTEFAGFDGLRWGSPRDEVRRARRDLRPGRKDPRVLVRETSRWGHPAVEAYFFGDDDRLAEVEVRFEPKRSAEESAGIARALDAERGPHAVSRADATSYQLAWVDGSNEVRLTYDLREEIPFGPVVGYFPPPVDPPPPVTPPPGKIPEER